MPTRENSQCSHADDAAETTVAAPTAVGYVRVSREERVREGGSLGAQCGRIAAYSEAKGLQLVEVLADEGLSGKDLERPGLE